MKEHKKQIWLRPDQVDLNARCLKFASKDQNKFWRDYHRNRRISRLKELLDERATYQGRVDACSRLISYYESQLTDDIGSSPE